MDYEFMFKVNKDTSVSKTAIVFIEDVLQDNKKTDRQKMDEIIKISTIAFKNFSLTK